MWPWLLIALFLDLPIHAASTQTGPVTDEEARILWMDAKREVLDKDFQEAVPKLRRLIDRYPSHAGFTEAHRLLGESLLALKRGREALPPLSYYIQAMGQSRESNQARLSLAEAYLSTGRFQEAELVTLELERQESPAAANPPLSRDLHFTGQLLKARALQGLGHPQKAMRLLESTRSGIRADETPLLALASRVELELKLADCARLPGPLASRLDEAQMKNAFERRGTCLSESLLAFESLLRKGTPEDSEDAGATLRIAHQEFAKACLSPPLPSDRRTAKEKRQYSAELAILLRKTCRTGLDRNFGLLESMKGDIPGSTLPIRKRVLEGLEKARKELGST